MCRNLHLHTTPENQAVNTSKMWHRTSWQPRKIEWNSGQARGQPATITGCRITAQPACPKIKEQSPESRENKSPQLPPQPRTRGTQAHAMADITPSPTHARVIQDKDYSGHKKYYEAGIRVFNTMERRKGGFLLKKRSKSLKEREERLSARGSVHNDPLSVMISTLYKVKR